MTHKTSLKPILSLITFVTLLFSAITYVNTYQDQIVLAQAGNNGAIWTTRNDCGTQGQDINHFAIGEMVYINGDGFDPNTPYSWDIDGQPGQASCDPGIAVASGNQTTDTNGAFCIQAYTVAVDDCGEYQVKFGNKGDNYQVDGLTPTVVPEPTPTVIIDPTPTLEPTPTADPVDPTATPTPTLESTPTSTLTPTLEPTPTSDPVDPTSTPTPTSVPTAIPTETSSSSNENTSSSNNSNDNNNSNNNNSPPPTSVPTSRPVVKSSGSILGATTTDNYNSLVDGIRLSYNGSVLGATTLARTGTSVESKIKLPSSNTLISDLFISVPKLKINAQVYQGKPIGQELVIGDQEILAVDYNDSTLFYGHNQMSVFGRLHQLKSGDSVDLIKNGQALSYQVIEVKMIADTDIEALNITDPDYIYLLTCSYLQPDKRWLVIAKLN